MHGEKNSAGLVGPLAVGGATRAAVGWAVRVCLCCGRLGELFAGVGAGGHAEDFLNLQEAHALAVVVVAHSAEDLVHLRGDCLIARALVFVGHGAFDLVAAVVVPYADRHVRVCLQVGERLVHVLVRNHDGLRVDGLLHAARDHVGDSVGRAGAHRCGVAVVDHVDAFFGHYGHGGSLSWLENSALSQALAVCQLR